MTAMSTYTIPNVIARTPGGERVLDVYSHLLTERVVYLGTEIDAGVANALIAQLLFLGPTTPTARCSSTSTAGRGPQRDARHLRHAAARPLPGRDDVRRPGRVGGRGAARRRGAGPPGRVAARPGRAAPARGAGPRVHPDLILQADELVRIRADIEEILARHTGQTVERLRADTDHDRVFTATAARDYGLLDTVLEPQPPRTRERR